MDVDPTGVKETIKTTAHEDLEKMKAKFQQMLERKEMSRKYFAEFFGTFWLVFGGCGSALISASYPNLGIGFLGVAFAFGFTVLTMVYAVGQISGGHFNPAVTLGLYTAGRIPRSLILPYIASQLLGALAGAGILYVIASGHAGFDPSAGFTSNGYGAHSPGGYSLMSALLAEVVLTFMFVLIILGSTDRSVGVELAPLAIGMSLTIIHLVSIPITNTSVNPARSTATAIFAGGWALEQLWLFWVAPIAGALLAGLVYPALSPKTAKVREITG
jgi:aquaporin Z